MPLISTVSSCMKLNSVLPLILFCHTDSMGNPRVEQNSRGECKRERGRGREGGKRERAIMGEGARGKEGEKKGESMGQSSARGR